MLHSERNVDYIISGQGLAGSCLALQLIRRRKRVLVLDQPSENRASAVAAGLFNPLTGKIMARTWLADELFDYLFNFYRESENLLGTKFFFPRPLYRPFISVQEQNAWMGKSADPPFARYVGHIYLSSAIEKVNDPFGGLLLNYSGHVDVPAFIKAVRQLLLETDSFRRENLIAAGIEILENGVKYRGTAAAGVIFCEGMAVSNNPFFSWLPINPLKGETINIELTQGAQLQYIINRGVYVVPSNVTDELTVGATYDFTSKQPGTTPGGREELEEKLQALIRYPYRVMAQRWGIRPTTLDQKIMIGPHPIHRNLLIFNGLGTKGVSQAPYFSNQLAGWLLGENEIMRDVNIERYKALYSKSE